MKKIIAIISLSIIVWSCSKKITPAASSTSISSNSGTAVAVPATAPASTATPAPVSPDSPSTIPVDASKPKTSEMMGQDIYNAKCGNCHGLKVTSDFTADRWISIMQVMATKAKLSDTEKDNVLAYVKANAKK